MSLGRVLLDSSVFIYAVGAEHPYREPCRAIVRSLVEGQSLTGEASVLAAQELLHQRARRTGDRAEAAHAARAMTSFCTLHVLTVEDMVLATEMFERSDGLDAAAACHAATAINRGTPIIVSPDRGFDGIGGLARLDPEEAAARL